MRAVSGGQPRDEAEHGPVIYAVQLLLAKMKVSIAKFNRPTLSFRLLIFSCTLQCKYYELYYIYVG